MVSESPSRRRHVISDSGKSSWFICDVHGWTYEESEELDNCPVCYGESLEKDRILQILKDKYDTYQVDAWLIEKHLLLKLMERIKGEKEEEK